MRGRGSASERVRTVRRRHTVEEELTNGRANKTFKAHKMSGACLCDETFCTLLISFQSVFCRSCVTPPSRIRYRAERVANKHSRNAQGSQYCVAIAPPVGHTRRGATPSLVATSPGVSILQLSSSTGLSFLAVCSSFSRAAHVGATFVVVAGCWCLYADSSPVFKAKTSGSLRAWRSIAMLAVCI